MTTPVSLNECRTAFERFVTDVPGFGSFRIDKRENGDYDSSHTHLMWLSWETSWKTCSERPCIHELAKKYMESINGN